LRENLTFAVSTTSETEYQGYETSGLTKIVSMTEPSIGLSETANHNNESRNSVGKNIEDDPLTSLIEANAQVLVRCPWMNGEIVTLSAAVLTYSDKVTLITAENIHTVASVMLGLLANPVEETEEQQEKDKPREKPPAQTEKADQKSNSGPNRHREQIKLNLANIEKQLKKEIDQPRHLEPVESKAEKVLATKALAAINSAPKNSARESIINEPDLAPNRPQVVAVQTTKPRSFAVSIDATTEPESMDLLPLATESRVTADDTTEPTYENTEIPEETSALAALDYQIIATDPSGFHQDDEIIFGHFEKSGSDPKEQNASPEVFESNLAADEEAPIYQFGDEIDLPAQMEIESTIVQLNERAKDAKPETSEVVNQILDKVIEVPAMQEINNDENIVAEAEVQEELKELFTKLLDDMGVDRTSKEVESFVYIFLKRQAASDIEKLKSEIETDDTPIASGTHEAIKSLLIGLSAIKKAIANAGQIGRSALKLYNSTAGSA
jgi:hypothetical protein